LPERKGHRALLSVARELAFALFQDVGDVFAAIGAGRAYDREVAGHGWQEPRQGLFLGEALDGFAVDFAVGRIRVAPEQAIEFPSPNELLIDLEKMSLAATVLLNVPQQGGANPCTSFIGIATFC
jgi:hypothetical protein